MGRHCNFQHLEARAAGVAGLNSMAAVAAEGELRLAEAEERQPSPEGAMLVAAAG